MGMSSMGTEAQSSLSINRLHFKVREMHYVPYQHILYLRVWDNKARKKATPLISLVEMVVN
jgi:hypothetical protein